MVRFVWNTKLINIQIYLIFKYLNIHTNNLYLSVNPIYNWYLCINISRWFYPVNKVSPLWINVNYNINNSHTERNTTTQQHNVYTFLWTSSPVLILTPPDFLELWSLQSITFETRSSIDIVILPFCNTM